MRWRLLVRPPSAPDTQRLVDDWIGIERAHEDAWYRRVAAEGFFEREGFRRLRAVNLAALRRHVPLGPSTRVLSIGCGSGEYELEIARDVALVVGIDLSPVAIAYARQRAERVGLSNVRFEAGALGDAEIGPGAFDVIIAFGVLHHLGESGRRDALRWARQRLVSGGWLYARDPSTRGLLRRLAGPWSRRSEFHSPNEGALDPRAVAQEVREAGFGDVRVDYTDVVAGPLPWLVASSAQWLWRAVALWDRAWLATPGLRRLASQYAIIARG
jgi:SAM-dependent methyltransferase